MKFAIPVTQNEDEFSFVCPFCGITYRCPFPAVENRVNLSTPLDVVVKQHLWGEHPCPKFPPGMKDNYSVKGKVVELTLTPEGTDHEG